MKISKRSLIEIEQGNRINSYCSLIRIFKIMWIVNTLILFLAFDSISGDVRIPAFPGGEGFGKYTLGGRGGDVYQVTNLKDTGPGSLRYGIKTADGPRTIVFEVAGTITLKSPMEIKRNYVT